MALKLSSGDVGAFKLLSLIAIMYTLISILADSVIHMKFIKPLGIEAPLDRFSEARAMEHIRVLAEEISGRQEGRPGQNEAARYIKRQLEMIKERAGSNIRIEIEENVVDGSFNMVFLRHSISLNYRNHKNIVMRILSVESQENETSVLLNSHYDAPLNSPGAGDCGSCVASMLEVARLVIDSGWTPTRPIIFLFNGAEELFMLGAHGFIHTYKWRDTIGAFINVEASGTGGPDLVCQSGPGSWPSLVYAQSAVYPMAHSAAQDVFPVIPGDTDYRIFAHDYGDIPGLDIIFLLGGYFYHTSYDTLENLLPGSIQARGENLFSVMKAFANTKLRNVHERETLGTIDDERAIFFDFLSWFMIFYSRRVAVVLHCIPFAIFLLMPVLLGSSSSGFYSWFSVFNDFIRGMLIHAAGVILAIIVPVSFSILRLIFSGYAMNWFAHPYLAYLMFIPCALVGLMIPRIVWRNFPRSQNGLDLKASQEALHNGLFWGAFGFYAVLTLVYHMAGLSGGFLTLFLSVSLLPAWISFSFSSKSSGYQSLRSTTCYILPLVPCIMYSMYFGGFLVQFLIEKMGMMGSFPAPYGYFLADIVVASVVGLVTGWCMGPLIPICSHWLARASVVKFLVHLSVLVLALSSQFFPYSVDAPKRVVFQHTVLTADADQVVESSYDFSVVDSNSLPFLFKYAPQAANELQISANLSSETANQSPREYWLALFPVSFLFSRSLRFAAKGDDVLKQYESFPHLSLYKPQTVYDDGSRKMYLELSLGSLREVWVSVLNITGPLSNWSFADNKLPAPEVVDGGPPSYICRLSGNSHENWTFWLEASSSEVLRVKVAVLDQNLMEPARKLKGLFPDWADVTAYSSFMSIYTF